MKFDLQISPVVSRQNKRCIRVSLTKYSRTAQFLFKYLKNCNFLPEIRKFLFFLSIFKSSWWISLKMLSSIYLCPAASINVVFPEISRTVEELCEKIRKILVESRLRDRSGDFSCIFSPNKRPIRVFRTRYCRNTPFLLEFLKNYYFQSWIYENFDFS